MQQERKCWSMWLILDLPSAPLPAAIVACVPKTLHVEGVGDKDFDITPEAILGAISDGLNEPLVRARGKSALICEYLLSVILKF